MNCNTQIFALAMSAFFATTCSAALQRNMCFKLFRSVPQMSQQLAVRLFSKKSNARLLRSYYQKRDILASQLECLETCQERIKEHETYLAEETNYEEFHCEHMPSALGSLKEHVDDHLCKLEIDLEKTGRTILHLEQQRAKE